MKEITAYVCDFCPRKKARLSKHLTKKHESICFYNPERRACASCGNYSFTPYHSEHDTGYFEGGPGCAVDYFITRTSEMAPHEQFRSECDKWIPKSVEVRRG